VLPALRTRFRDEFVMRWIDAPEPPARRTVAAWCEAMHDLADASALAAIAERARHVAPGSSPIVAIEATAVAAAQDHVRGSALERGGLLVGEPLANAAGAAWPALVYVRAAVPGLDDDATEYSLRLHAGVWDAARAVLRSGEVVVGWFHSHPGIGAFFSGTDRRTQAGFFNHPFSLGWVIDPLRGEQAWFVGRLSEELAAEAILALAQA
jgi:proteasome lid subunit RPN8/RPN11